MTSAIHAALAAIDAALSRLRAELGAPLSTDLELPVDSLGFSPRVRNVFRSARIRTLGDIVTRSENDLRCLKNFGAGSMREVYAVLDNFNLGLR